MKSKFSTCLVVLAALTTLTLPSVLASQNAFNCQSPHHHYQLIDLGTLGGSAYKSVNAPGYQILTNDSGLPEIHATLWHDNQIIDIGTFGGHWGVGSTLNDAGDVVGFASNLTPDPYALFPPAGTQTRAFLWRNGVLRDAMTR
jgi:hypothetical protein